MDQKAKMITIVVPVINRAGLVERTLDSIARQRLDGFKIVVVDNGSTDSTLQTVSRWIASHDRNGNFSVITELTKGAPAARNAGLKCVDTPYVMFFDSDDEMLPGHLEMVAKGVAENPDADILGWNVDQQLPTGRRQTGRFDDHTPLFRHLVHSILSTQRYVARTELVRHVGAWNESVRGWNDYELGVRLLLESEKIVKLNAGNKPTVKINFTCESITGTSFSTDCDKWEHSLDLIEHTLKERFQKALPWIGYRRAVLAADYLRELNVKDCFRLLRKAIGSDSPELLTLILFFNHLIFHRGSWIIASKFLPSDF